MPAGSVLSTPRSTTQAAEFFAKEKRTAIRDPQLLGQIAMYQADVRCMRSGRICSCADLTFDTFGISSGVILAHVNLARSIEEQTART